MVIRAIFEGETLKNKIEKLKDLSNPLKKIAIHLQSESQKTFERNTGRVTPWPDLSEKTKKRKIRAKGTAYPILVFHGRLRASITHEVSENTAEVYTGVHYGPYHQYGTSRIPTRPFLEIDESTDVPFAIQQILEHLRS
jgi:phage gpG-like protein